MKKSLCVLSGLCLVLASCAGTRPAPVEDRPAAATPSVAAQPAPSTPVRTGTHIVSKGDTLFSIALEYGQDWRDLVIWNRIENPNLIRIGQELRVTPPDGAVETRPISTTGAVEVRPLEQETAKPPSVAAVPATVVESANTAVLKREPRGGVEPYSEETLARVRAGSVALASPVAASAQSAAATPASATSSPTPAPIVSAPDAVRSEDGIEWSWPANGRIMGRFGEGTNKGVDVAGRTGEPVLAAAGGRVVYAGEAMRGYGKLVIVKHDSTYLSAYAHNSKILVQERDAVKRGQRIAEIGDTDTEAGKPRLHFEIRRQGKPVDPLKYLPPR